MTSNTQTMTSNTQTMTSNTPYQNSRTAYSYRGRPGTGGKPREKRHYHNVCYVICANKTVATKLALRMFEGSFGLFNTLFEVCDEYGRYPERQKKLYKIYKATRKFHNRVIVTEVC